MRTILPFCLVLCLLLPGISQSQQISDTNLKTCIAASTGKPFSSLTDKDLSDITSLGCRQKSIQSIAGIEKLTNLKVLNLNDNQITDITTLIKLNHLEILQLWNNNIKDISPLAGLKNLKELHLERNRIKDLRPLAKLNNVKELLLGANQIDDITPLAGLNKLFWLELYENQITDISPLAKLTMLEYLDLSKNSINTIDTLKDLKKLGQLYLQDNQINDIKPLAGIKTLTTLFLGQNTISDISSLSGLAELKFLDLDNNLISDLSPLDNNKHLNRLSLLNNCIRTLPSIGPIENLTGMNFQHNLCDSPTVVKRNISQGWLDKQAKAQCVEYGANDYSLKNDYEYHPDGFYYNFYQKKVKEDKVNKLACKISWNGKIENFLNSIEEVESKDENYTVFQYKRNYIFVQDGLIKGYSVNNLRKAKGDYSVLKDISEFFQQTYKLKKQGSGHQLIAKGNGHTLKIVDKDQNYDLQFFEPEFFGTYVLTNQ